MTLQTSDHLLRDGQRQTVLDASRPLFDPVALGYRPTMRTTACIRGYVCGFELLGGVLRLHTLAINHQPGRAPITRRRQPPDLNGVAAIERPDDLVADWHFEGVALPLAFTGGLLVGFDRRAVARSASGWRAAWLYAHVRELVFEAGALVAETVLDESIAPIRERALAADKRVGLFRDVDYPALAACLAFDYDARART